MYKIRMFTVHWVICGCLQFLFALQIHRVFLKDWQLEALFLLENLASLSPAGVFEDVLASTTVKVWDVHELKLVYVLEDYELLVGGDWNILIKSSQLTNSIIFQRGRYTTNQVWVESFQAEVSWNLQRLQGWPCESCRILNGTSPRSQWGVQEIPTEKLQQCNNAEFIGCNITTTLYNGQLPSGNLT